MHPSSLQSDGMSVKSAVELEQERMLKEQNTQKLKEVEQQQEDFGEKIVPAAKVN